MAMQIQDMAGQAFNQVTGGKGGDMLSFIKAPWQALKSFVGGLFSGALWFGLPLLALQHFAPSAFESLTSSLGLKEQATKLLGADAGKLLENPIVLALGLGSLVGGGVGAVKGGVGGVVDSMGGNGDSAGKITGTVLTAGLAILATSVVIGAVKNGNLKTGDSKAPHLPFTLPKVVETAAPAVVQ